MILFFLIISVGNLALGYFVALKYHSLIFPEPVRERELVRAPSTPAASPITIDASQLPLISRDTPLPTEQAMPQEQPPSENAIEPEVLVAEPPQEMQSPSQVNPATPIGTESETEAETAQQEAAIEDAQPAKNETAVSLDDFMSGLLEFRSQLSSLDDRVRKCVKAPDSREVDDCLKEFRVANSLYLEQTTEAAERLQQPEQAETADQSEARSAVQKALTSQVEEVRKAEEELDQIELSSDVEASCETLLRNANSLNASNEKLREELHVAQREFQPEQEQGVDVDNENLLVDELTQIPSRYQLEMEMRQIVKSGEAYCVGLLDVDRCGELNLKYGQRTVDGVIKSLAQIVAASARKEACAARYSGQQFAVLFAGQEPAEAALSAETIRQIVEQTSFRCDEEPLEVTVSMVLIAGSSSDTLTTIEQRLRTAISAGKSFGKNRTFQFQDGDVEPILPPELDIQSSICEVKP